MLPPHALRIAARYRSTHKSWRWVLFACGWLLSLTLDSVLVDSDGFSMLPAFGAWVLTIGWLWGGSWLLCAAGFSILGLIVGLGPPPMLAIPMLITYVAGAAWLRRNHPIIHPLWDGYSVAAVSTVAGIAGLVGALPYAMETLWQYGSSRFDDPMLWLRVCVVPPIATLAWVFFLAPLYRLGDPKVLSEANDNRWGWPRRGMDTLGILGIGAGVALLLALSPPVELWPWALIAAIVMVLAGALAFNLVGGAVGALFGCIGSSLIGNLETATDVTVVSTHLSHMVLVIVGLVAGSFASHARTRQDEWAQNVNRYRSLLDSMPIGFVELDERGFITQANPMAGQIVGCESADLLGHPFDRLALQEVRPDLVDTLGAIRYRRQRAPRFFSQFLYRPDSSARNVQVDWVYQPHDSRRGPVRITALLTDITERRRAIKALRDRERLLAERSNLLRITMDALDHGLAVFGPDHCLAEWNAKFPEMLRLPAPLGRPGTPAIAIFRFLATLGAFGVGVTEAHVSERMNLLLDEPYQDDVHWIGKRHLRFTSHTMPNGGWVWRIEDRTEDVHTYEIEQNRQKMEALGQLASGVAHELNNTLQPIFSLSELGSTNVEENSIAERCFTRITDAAERAEGIVRGVLTFARNAPAASDECRLIPAIHDAVAFVSAGLPAQIRLETQMDDTISADAVARLDQRELGQVITNLITNAADAMDHKGLIELRCRPDILRHTPEGDSTEVCEISVPAVAISVTDSGKGMDHLTRQRIFEPFYTTKGEGHGTGLGLAVAFGIVRNWGGRIDVTSEPGLGSTFTVWVPILMGHSAITANTNNNI